MMAVAGSRIGAAAIATPESQAFIESWFDKLKRREPWLSRKELVQVNGEDEGEHNQGKIKVSTEPGGLQ
jgi:hypothetical protein